VVVLFCLALWLLAGCATTPPQNGGETPVLTGPTNSTPVAVRPVTPGPRGTNTAPVISHTNAPPPVTHPAPVIIRPAPLLAWTSLARWAAANHLPGPRKTADSPLTTFTLNSPRGTLTLFLGSREAGWNGVFFHLGYPPEIVDGELVLYGVDILKNLEPLLLDPPLALPVRPLVVIDPGHGGINGGTVSVLDQHPEKEFTLDCARRLKPLLEAQGWRVLLTHTNDIDLSLSNRVRFAEDHRADLFISLHFNSAAPDRRQSGLETYCLTPAGLPSTLVRDKTDPLGEVFPNNTFDAANLQLALCVHHQLAARMGEEDRGVRRARFMGVLHGQGRPAILIEGGFLSNPAEARRIESPAFRQQYAETIAAALRGLLP